LAFEMHDFGVWPAGRLEHIIESDVLTYCPARRAEIPRSIEYPLNHVEQETGFDFFGSTIDYMLALAVTAKPQRIGIWGVSGDEEYSYQRVSLAAWMGLAIGRGIAVYPRPDWFRWRDPGGLAGVYSHRYGWVE